MLVLQPPVLVLVSVMMFCCLTKEEKTKQNKKQKTKTKQINPKFKCNTLSVSPSASNPSSVVVSSKNKRNKQTKKRVWRQLCECLSEAVAHLPPTVSQLLLWALFMQL
jgi:hypothetical protein